MLSTSIFSATSEDTMPPRLHEMLPEEEEEESLETTTTTTRSPNPGPPLLKSVLRRNNNKASGDKELLLSSSSSSSSSSKCVRFADPDPYHFVDRFIFLQRATMTTALNHIRRASNPNERSSCGWLCFLLPRIVVSEDDLFTDREKRHSFQSDEECRAYLQFIDPNVVSDADLRENYLQVLAVIEKELTKKNKKSSSSSSSMQRFFGPQDRHKALSSIRLFERIANDMNDPELSNACARVLALEEQGGVGGKNNKTRRTSSSSSIGKRLLKRFQQ